MTRPFTLQARRVDPSLNRITTASGETVQIEPKVMQVLVALAEHPGEVVTRDELMARVWNGVFVTDDALHRAIRELRRVFDDEADAPRVIETIRKRGYRLIAPLAPADSRPGTVRDPQPAPTRRAWREHIAALFAIAIAGLAAIVWLLGRHDPSPRGEAQVRFLPLTSDPGNEIDPALSASGRLAYVARGADGRGHIFTKASANAVATQVTHSNGVERAPTWSADESQLAFVRTVDGACSIWIAAADGREARTIAPCTTENELHMSWSPDGRLLALTAGGTTLRSPSHIEVMDVATGDRRAVTEPVPGHVGDWSPAFSPNGREIAFVRSAPTSVGEVCIVDVQGGQPRCVTGDNADIMGVDWEPSGQYVVFSSERAGGISIWRVLAAPAGENHGPVPELLAGGGSGKLKHPSVARQRGIVAYEDWQYEINLYERSTEERPGDTATALSPTSDRWNFHPQISPDGKRLAFQSTRSGAYELWVSDRDGGNARPLTRSAVYKSMPKWSPDGRQLAFSTRERTEAMTRDTTLSVLNVESGELKVVARSSGGVVAPSWSHDGAAIYAGSNIDTGWHIYKYDVASGEVRRVSGHPAYAAMESTDGHWLYYTRLDRPGLWRLPLDERGDAVLVDASVPAEQSPNWGLYERGVYFVRWPDAGDPQLALLEDGATRERLMTRLPEYAWPGIAITRDGARVIYAHADRRASNIGAVIRTAAPSSDRSSLREAPVRNSREAPQPPERTARR